MNREKQIDEMKNCLCDVLDFDYDDERGVTKVDAKTTAERLYNAGYRRFDYLTDAISEEIFAWKKHYESLFETAKATIREEVAREIFKEIDKMLDPYGNYLKIIRLKEYIELKKKYTEGEG